VIARVATIYRFEAVAVEPGYDGNNEKKNKAAKTTEAAEHSGSSVRSKEEYPQLRRSGGRGQTLRPFSAGTGDVTRAAHQPVNFFVR
jgi:hypothetical protein